MKKEREGDREREEGFFKVSFGLGEFFISNL